MDPSLYPQMAAVEDAHWWFAGRRAIVDRIINRLDLPPAAAILEPGCGTGGNFPLLAPRGRLHAFDADQSALRFADARRLASVARGFLPDAIPFGDRRFDLVVMTDVLEHLDHPADSLRALRARMHPAAALLLTVPATPWLWSDHDVTHHHRVRFRATELRNLVTDSGFAVDYLSYYNFLLFPLIAGTRLLQRLSPRHRSADRLGDRPNDRSADRSGDRFGVTPRHDLAMPSTALNAILRRIFASERYLVGTARIPFGVSLILLAHPQ